MDGSIPTVLGEVGSLKQFDIGEDTSKDLNSILYFFDLI